MLYPLFEKKKRYFIGAGVMFFCLSFLMSVGQYVGQQQLQQSLSQKVIRFHVLANSDCKEDQELKLMVRDAVGGYMQEKMKGMEDKAACKRMIEEQLKEIEEIAANVIAREGYSYPVSASLTECDFPQKTYGAYTFPAGEYEALRLVIGEGEGQNWWCVMYPNMCFENSMYEVVDGEAKEALRRVLDDKEYEAVLASGKYEIRFRFLEWFR